MLLAILKLGERRLLNKGALVQVHLASVGVGLFLAN